MQTCARARIAPLIVLVAALLVACGDDGDDGAGGGNGEGSDNANGDSSGAAELEQSYVDAFVEDATSNEDFAATEDEAACFGQRLVQVFGAEELQGNGISPEEFAAAEAVSDLDVDVPEDAREQVESAITDCFDDLRGTLARAFGAEAGVDAGCLAENVDEQDLAAAVTDLFLAADEGAMEEVLLSNVTPACAEGLLIERGGRRRQHSAGGCAVHHRRARRPGLAAGLPDVDPRRGTQCDGLCRAGGRVPHLRYRLTASAAA